MQAAQLLHTHFFCDGHVDTFRNILKRGGDFVVGSGGWQVSFPRMRECGLNLQIAAVYTSKEEAGPTSCLVALKVIEGIHRAVEASRGALKLVTTRSELRELAANGGHGLLIALEGADPLLTDLDLLDVFYRLGLRAIGLTHNHNSPSAGGCGVNPEEGLSEFGVSLLQKMSQLGIALDTAHLGRKAFADVLRHYRGPLINSHSCCDHLVPMERNVTDEQLRAVAASGGLTGVTFVPKFLVTSGECTSHHVFAHLRHMVEVAGIDHVAIGSDFDGTDQLPSDLKEPRDFVHLVERMQEAGWSETDVEKVLGGNWLRVLASVLP